MCPIEGYVRVEIGGLRESKYKTRINVCSLTQTILYREPDPDFRRERPIKETKRVEVVGICRVSQEQLPGFFEGVKKEFVSPYPRLDSIPKEFEQVVLRKLIKASTMLKLS